jgi:tetratricopeptide (TPR) repeat protein
MKPFVACGVLALLCLCFAPGRARAQTSESFDDLVRRAEASLDTRPAEAVDLYKKALAIRPDWAPGWLYMGAGLYGLDRFAESAAAFRKGLTMMPREGKAWAFLGMAEAGLGNNDQALADIRKGEELGLGDNHPFEVAARVTAARILIRSSSFDEALSQLQPLARKEENSPSVVETMGLCALTIPHPLAEVAEAKRPLVRLAGKAAWALASQRPEQAAGAYQQLLANYPNEPGVHYAHGLYMMETDLGAAMADFQKELKNNPGHWPTLILLASIQTRRGTPEQALDSLRLALKTVPAKYRWLCRAEMGRAYITADNVPAALTELQSAARLLPANPQIHFLLARAYRQSGRAEEAAKETLLFQKYKALQDPLGVPAFQPFAFGAN